MTETEKKHEHDYVTACFDCGHIVTDGQLQSENTALRKQLAESERVVKMASSYERGARQKIEDLESKWRKNAMMHEKW